MVGAAVELLLVIMIYRKSVPFHHFHTMLAYCKSGKLTLVFLILKNEFPSTKNIYEK